MQAEVVALEENVQALQKQLEQSELENVNQRAQIETLSRLTGRPAAAAAQPREGAGVPAEPDAWRPGPASQPQPGPPQTNDTACSEVGTRCTQTSAHTRFTATTQVKMHVKVACLHLPYLPASH